MDRNQFDRLSRLVATAGTRRAALRTLLAGAVTGAALGASPPAEDVSAARKRGKQRRTVRGEAVCPSTCNQNCSNKKLQGGANLSRCNYNERDLDGVKLNSANLSGACFGNASLRNADLRSTNVSGACFCGADLTGANLRGSNITTQQLACAIVGCNTILPNGKFAVACRQGTTCCDGVCVDTQTDPLNCGQCGTRCQINGICDQGQCACVLGCNDYRFGFQCCPADSPVASCSCGLGKLTDPLNCDIDIPEEDCPPAQRCIGPNCKTCCPLNSTCDPSTGTCLQQPAPPAPLRAAH